MDASRLIQLADETRRKVDELGRALRKEQTIAKSEKRKAAVTEMLAVVDDIDAKLIAGNRTFEDKMLS